MRGPHRNATASNWLRLGLRTSVCIALGALPSCVVDDAAGEGPPNLVAPLAAAHPAHVYLDPVAADADPSAPRTGRVCSSDGPGYRCFAHVHADAVGEHVEPSDSPQGYTPADLQDAYSVPTALTSHPLVGVVDAYAYPNLESDLAAYRAQFDLPACTSKNGCLRIVGQDGTSNLPTQTSLDAGLTDDWTVETALDVDMVSAACPQCNILVVLADDKVGYGLDIGQGTAAQLGARVISDSWGGPEQPGVSLAAVENYFDQSVPIFAAAGDQGYDDGGSGPDYPGTSAHTISVGGTSLVKASNARGWSETAWSLGGSACSLSIGKPAYQTNTNCQFKATTDISAEGDPVIGMAMYNADNGGWTTIGGTSAAAPFVAALFAATGNDAAGTTGAFVAANPAKLHDVTSGSNGACGNSLCVAGAGWDGPTGYGTPDGAQLDTGKYEGDNPYAAGEDPGVVSGGCSASGASGGDGGLALAFAALALLSVIGVARRLAH